MTHRRKPTRDDQQAGDNCAEDELKVLDSSGEESVNGSMTDPFTHPGARTAPPTANTAVDPFTALTQSFTPKRAVSYLRVSTREQAERGGREEGFSIPAQRDANKKKARTLGAEVVKEFVERGVSGTTTRRPALQEMLKYLEEEAENIDYVIVHKIDRLARSVRDSSQLNSQLEDWKIRLISTSENIDQTPGGMLLHGIMSSIAEFYSRNLANEVVKGMRQKVEQGGTPSIAPIGYLNQRIITGGRDDATVIPDPERARFVTMAFKEYATGNWTTSALRVEMNARGFTSRPTKTRPSGEVPLTTFQNMLKNPYFTGKVMYNGVAYPGNHPALIDEETFAQVQSILASNDRMGQRDRKHDHFLKSTLWCGQCAERMILQKVTNNRGDRYDYFACAGRHSRRTNCQLRFAPIDWLEENVEKIHERLRLSPEYRQELQLALGAGLKELQRDTKQEHDALTRKLQSIDRKQRKLLELHYSDASPVEILRDEQVRLQREANIAKQRLEAIRSDFEQGERLIAQALDLAENAGKAYRIAPDSLKRQLNQIFFTKIFVHEDELGEHALKYALEPPFDIIFSQLTRKIVEQNTAENRKVVESSTTATGAGDLASPEKRKRPAKSGGSRSSELSYSTPISQVVSFSNRTMVADLVSRRRPCGED